MRTGKGSIQDNTTSECHGDKDWCSKFLPSRGLALTRRCDAKPIPALSGQYPELPDAAAQHAVLTGPPVDSIMSSSAAMATRRGRMGQGLGHPAAHARATRRADGSLEAFQHPGGRSS